MTDTELFELCKEVWKIWNEDIFEFDYALTPDGNGDDLPVPVTLYGRDIEYTAPLYTSDYLLEKLPKKNIQLTYDQLGREWRAIYAEDLFTPDRTRGNADTPLKALLKLVLALKEAGVEI